jgi:hypothetical protein
MKERFEMRLDEQILASVDRWRADQGDVPSRAEAIRRLIEIGIAKVSTKTVRFSDGERLLVTMLRDISKQIRSGKSPFTPEVDPEFVGEVLWGGHYWALKWELEGLFHDHEDDPADVSLVVDVLDLWDFLEQGHEELSKKDKERVEKEAEPFGKHVRFMGFDGNNETTHMSIARFLVEKMGRFQRFKGRELNSHSPSIAVYNRMLSVFLPLRSTLVGRSLNADEIIAILKAKRYPEARR